MKLGWVGLSWIVGLGQYKFSCAGLGEVRFVWVGLGMFRSGWDRLGKVGFHCVGLFGQARLSGLVGLSEVRKGYTRLCYVGFCLVRSGWVG